MFALMVALGPGAPLANSAASAMARMGLGIATDSCQCGGPHALVQRGRFQMVLQNEL